MYRRQDLISPEGLRSDGRRPAELRTFDAKLGVFAEADGSALVSHGNTRCLCLVFGPREPAVRSNAQDKASIRVHFEKKDKKSVDAAHSLQSLFENVIHTSLYPRSQIDIYLQVLQLDGGSLHATINATTLALIDAGISMTDYVAACSSGHASDPILDLNYAEESSNVPSVTIACLRSSLKVCMMEIDGRIPADNLQDVSECALQGCKELGNAMDSYVKLATIKRASE